MDNGYTLIAENTPWDAQRGDIFIWGRKGYSSGAGGHTGMFVDENNIIHCNYRFDGITVNDHDDIWMDAGRPYYYVYRLTNPDATPVQLKTGWNSDSKGYWFVRDNGSYPTSEFEYIEENKSWFYFDANGYMVANDWVKYTDGKWYWFDRDGYMAVNWKKIDGKWYFFNRDGAMQTGWVKYYDNWYYLDAVNGDMKSDAFIRYNDGWYLLREDGRLEEKPAFTIEPDGLITTK